MNFKNSKKFINKKCYISNNATIYNFHKTRFSFHRNDYTQIQIRTRKTKSNNNSLYSKLSGSGQTPIFKYFTDHILPQIKSSKIVQRTLELTRPIEWNEQLFKEILASFKKTKQLKQLKNSSIEIGIELPDHNAVVKNFVETISKGELDGCKSEQLKEIFIENGKVGVEKTLKSAFLEFSQDYMSNEHKQRYNSLKQLSDLSTPIEWHPEARSMQRKIILHVGPTNSGKTYNALKCLETAKSGIYCGPLRLLANEIFDRMNNNGIPCNLVTGEERKELDGIYVPLTSSTVEMANLNRQLDVAVIDEIQMISDPFRGWAWTQALLGLKAKEIHICGEPARSESNKVEVREYKRLSKLVICDYSLKNNLKGIQKGDCVVTFSRKEIFALKRNIENTTGLRCAVAYGGLPPGISTETRTLQAKLFNDPDSEYDVLIASDAVGMGLNLNIKRIVFETVRKFNGTDVRLVSPPQIKQIAGRAGRYGTTNAVGEVTALDPLDLQYIKKAMEVPRLQPTMQMVELFAHQLPDLKQFSALLEKFESLARVGGQYFLCNFTNQKLIANSIEHIHLTIPERFIFVTAPINTNDLYLMKKVQMFARLHGEGKEVLLEDFVRISDKIPSNTIELKELESKHRTIMLYLWLTYRLPETFVGSDVAKETKSKCEDLIHESLQSLKFAKTHHKWSTGQSKKTTTIMKVAPTNKNQSEMQEKLLTRIHPKPIPAQLYCIYCLFSNYIKKVAIKT
ncbi:5555_t:CDS:10 [Entrophospora sp. SA101]|nr:5555_t:CDS:10 [Entrophospora sp. SA101]